MRLRHVVATVAVAVALVYANPALATHNHPFKANKFLALFVRSMNACAPTSATHSHNPPLAFPACSPSSVSTVLSFGPKGFGQAKGVVKLNSLKQATDVALIAKFLDVRNGDDGTGTGFSGVLSAAGIIRTTDHNCDGALNNPCTLIDVPFPVSLPCGTSATPPLPPGKCLSITSANATVANVIKPGAQANVGLQQLQVYSGSNLVFEEGLYLP